MGCVCIEPRPVLGGAFPWRHCISREPIHQNERKWQSRPLASFWLCDLQLASNAALPTISRGRAGWRGSKKSGGAAMRIARRFTTESQDPYEHIDFRTATSEIRNPDGSV